MKLQAHECRRCGDTLTIADREVCRACRAETSSAGSHGRKSVEAMARQNARELTIAPWARRALAGTLPPGAAVPVAPYWGHRQPDEDGTE